MAPAAGTRLAPVPPYVMPMVEACQVPPVIVPTPVILGKLPDANWALVMPLKRGQRHRISQLGGVEISRRGRHAVAPKIDLTGGKVDVRGERHLIEMGLPSRPGVRAGQDAAAADSEFGVHIGFRRGFAGAHGRGRAPAHDGLARRAAPHVPRDEQIVGDIDPGGSRRNVRETARKDGVIGTASSCSGEGGAPFRSRSPRYRE